MTFDTYEETEFNTSMNLHYSQTSSHVMVCSLWFNTSMNLHYSQTNTFSLGDGVCLIPLWIYITLKPKTRTWKQNSCLIPLWIYITLKQDNKRDMCGWSLIPLWIYITLKPQIWENGLRPPCKFNAIWLHTNQYYYISHKSESMISLFSFSSFWYSIPSISKILCSLSKAVSIIASKLLFDIKLLKFTNTNNSFPSNSLVRSI